MPDGDQRPTASLAVNLLHSDETPPAAAEKQMPPQDPTPRNLAYVLTLGFFGLLFMLCFRNAPTANLAMLNIVLGSLGTAWVGSMTYFFGATQGGRAKDLDVVSEPAQSAFKVAQRARAGLGQELLDLLRVRNRRLPSRSGIMETASE